MLIQVVILAAKLRAVRTELVTRQPSVRAGAPSGLQARFRGNRPSRCNRSTLADTPSKPRLSAASHSEQPPRAIEQQVASLASLEQPKPRAAELADLPLTRQETRIFRSHSPVAQLVEQPAVNRLVVGSSPTGGASSSSTNLDATQLTPDAERSARAFAAGALRIRFAVAARILQDR